MDVNFNEMRTRAVMDTLELLPFAPSDLMVSLVLASWLRSVLLSNERWMSMTREPGRK